MIDEARGVFGPDLPDDIREVLNRLFIVRENRELYGDLRQRSFSELLEVFFVTHDPTTLNRQGADHGARYRSVILYTSDAQKDRASEFITELDGSGDLPGPVVTEIAKFEKFFEAEAEHKQFYLNNQSSMYCQIVISPKVAKVRQKFTKSLR